MSITLNGEALIGTSLTFRTEFGNLPPMGFSSVVAGQIPGTPDQARLNGVYRGPNTTLYVRLKSNYTSEGKDVAGGFPITLVINNAEFGYPFQIDSNAGLTDGTAYTFMFYTDDTVTQDPTGNAVYTANTVTIDSGADPVPTLISPLSLTIPYGSVAGTVIGQLGSDVPTAVFTEGSPDLALAEIDSDGTLTISAGQTANVAGPNTFKAIATAGGVPFSADVTLTVSAEPPPPDPGDGTMDADVLYTGASAWTNAIAAANAALASNAAWDALMAGYGKAITDDMIIGVTRDHTGDINVNGMTRRPSRGRLIFRGVGTVTDANGGLAASRITGRIYLENCNGIGFYGHEVVLAQSSANAQEGIVYVGGSTDCLLDRMDIRGAGTLNTAFVPQLDFGIFSNVNTGEVTRLTVRRTRIQGVVSAIRTRTMMTDCIFDRVTCNYISDDFFDMSAGGNGLVVHHCVSAAIIVAAFPEPGTNGNYNGAHEDLMQMRDGSYSNVWFHHNVQLKRNWYFDGVLRAVRDLDLGGQSNRSGQQMFYFGGGSVNVSGIIEQNFMCGTNYLVKGGTPSLICRYNTALTPDGCEASNQGMDGSVDYNFTTSQASTVNKGSGPNGVNVNVGGPLADTTAAVASYFPGDIIQHAPIENFLPVNGSRVGAWEVMKEWFNDDAGMLEDGWPVAQVIRATVDFNSYLTTTYSGSYDADFGNA
jgi:hypothetical protein